MKKLIILGLFAFYAMLLQAGENKSLLGSWDFKVEGAPYEYSLGKLNFSEKDGQVTGVVKFADGTEIKVYNLKIGENVFSCKADVANNEVTLNAKIVENKISGKIDSPQGVMNLTAEHAKK